MPLILGTNSIKDTGYDVANSLMFSSDHYLTKSFSSAGNRQSWTWSAWIKRSKEYNGSNTNANRQVWFGGYTASNDTQWLEFGTQGDIFYYTTNSLSATGTRLMRDTSAWFHAVVIYNGSNIKFYFNNVLDCTLSLSGDRGINVGGTHTIGALATNQSSRRFEGYMTEVCFIDGSQLDPDQFGEFDEDSGIWKPIDVSGLTFGTNGFYLDFENSGSLGADVSGNGNNFTVNNLTSIDQTTDTCTNNFATLNPLNTSTNITMAEGNTKITTSTNGWLGSAGTIGITKGFPCYWEAKATTNTRIYFGLSRLEDYDPVTGTTTEGQSNLDYMWRASSANLVYYRGSSQSVTVSAVSAGDILACSVDSSGNVKFYNNGSAIHTFSTVLVDGYFYFPILSVNGFTSTETMEANFGNPAFSISSGNTDADGYGNFEYAPPANHYALCTKNLAEYG